MERQGDVLGWQDGKRLAKTSPLMALINADFEDFVIRVEA